MLAAAAVITPVATADTDVEPASSPLIIANSHSWAPLSYVENGEPKGMLIDFWHLYEHYNHQTVAFQLVDWGDSIEAVRSGSASVHAGLLKSPEREAFLLFTKPIFPLVTALFARLEHKDAALAMTLPVGVVTKSYEAEFMAQRHPDTELVYFDNSRELVQAAHERRVSALVSDLPTGIHFLREFGEERSIAMVKALYSKPIHAAVPINRPELLARIQAGIDRIPREHIRAIAERRPVNLSGSERSMKQLPWLGLKALMLVLVLALVWWAVKGLFGVGGPTHRH